MTVRTGFVAIYICVALIVWSPQNALAYSGATGIDFTVSTHYLHGYSRTWKDWYDPDYYYDCLSWSESDWGGYQCWYYQIQTNYSHVKADLYSPSGLYHTIPQTDRGS